MRHGRLIGMLRKTFTRCTSRRCGMGGAVRPSAAGLAARVPLARLSPATLRTVALLPLTLLPLTLLAVALLPAAAPARGLEGQELNVRRMVLGETRIAAGAQQLFQVTLANTGQTAVPAGLRVELRDARDRRVGSPILRRVTLPAKDEPRFLFKFAAPREPGDYAVRFEALSPDYSRPLIPGGPVFFSPFSVGEATPRPGPGLTEPARIGPPRFQPPSGLNFERPDLLWERVIVDPPNLLLGEALRIRADLLNVGGDLARDFMVRVVYFHTRTPDRTELLSESGVRALAPGERLELEFETVLPDDALLGEYRVALRVDAEDSVDELDETNNRVITDAIRLSRIKLIFPEPGFAFEEQGLFLFRWDSLRYEEFKVQVGTDVAFSDPANYFDLPQGEKWAREKEIVPLEGELPGMAQGLLERTAARQLYWRVQGRDRDGFTDVSIAQPFTITAVPRPQETPPPAADPGGAPPIRAQ